MVPLGIRMNCVLGRKASCKPSSLPFGSSPKGQSYPRFNTSSTQDAWLLLSKTHLSHLERRSLVGGVTIYWYPKINKAIIWISCEVEDQNRDFILQLPFGNFGAEMLTNLWEAIVNRAFNVNWKLKRRIGTNTIVTWEVKNFDMKLSRDRSRGEF